MPSTSSHLLPYRRNPFVGSLRHGGPLPFPRGLYDLLPPEAQRKHAALVGDDRYIPRTLGVWVTTRQQASARAAKHAACADSVPALTLPPPAPQPVSTQTHTAELEAWAMDMGQILFSRR